jgi:hypothetical protein
MFGASKDLHDSVPSQKRSWQAFGESSGKGCPYFEQKIVFSSDLSCPAAGGLSQSYSSLGRAGEEQH